MKYNYDGRISYSFAEYKGKEFLEAYEKNRNNALRFLENPVPIDDFDEILLKFYEVNKKISEVDGYVILSINFFKKYNKNKDIRYLNSILKLNDFICANITQIKSKFIKMIATNIISFELNEIKRRAEDG